MTGMKGLLGTFACVLLVSGCATAAGSSEGSSGGDATEPTQTIAQPVDCRTLLDTVIQRERLGDAGGAINAELDVLGDQCPNEYLVAVDYASIKVMSGVDPGGTCPDPLEFNVEPEAVELARGDALCTYPPNPVGSRSRAPLRRIQDSLTGHAPTSPATTTTGTTMWSVRTGAKRTGPTFESRMSSSQKTRSWSLRASMRTN
jgi:hypothetical protein